MIAGPILYSLLGRAGLPQRRIDAAVIVLMVGIIAVEVLPEAWRVAGVYALLWLLLGALLPTVAEHGFKRFAHEAHMLTLVLALIGMGVHSFVDGVAVATEGHDHGMGLGVAVVLHRLPVATTVWWLLRPQFGPFYGAAVIGLMMAATALGYFGGERLLSPLSDSAMASFQMLVAGLLLHVLFNKPHADHQH